jgi:hypothetical protein
MNGLFAQQSNNQKLFTCSVVYLIGKAALLCVTFSGRNLLIQITFLK